LLVAAAAEDRTVTELLAVMPGWVAALLVRLERLALGMQLLILVAAVADLESPGLELDHLREETVEEE
jgi:hypothetical protein